MGLSEFESEMYVVFF